MPAAAAGWCVARAAKVFGERRRARTSLGKPAPEERPKKPGAKKLKARPRVEHVPVDRYKAQGDIIPGSTLRSVLPSGFGLGQDKVRRLVLKDFDLEKAPAMWTASQAASLTEPQVVAEGMTKLNSGQVEEARRLFAVAVQYWPENGAMCYYMGLCYEVLHQPLKMVRWMDMALFRSYSMVMAWVLRSKYMEHHGQLSDALKGYKFALELEPRHPLAQTSHAGLLGMQAVKIEPRSVWGQAEVLAESVPNPSWSLPAWQENFVRPLEASPLRQPLLEGGVMAWDNVLSEALLKRVDRTVNDYYEFAFTNGWIAEDHAAATCWLPSSAEPATAAELAARCILQKIIGEDPADWAGVEYWGRVRAENLGAGLHYDQAEDSHDVDGDWVNGNPWRPEWSTVLYLTDEGGPTVVFEQLTSKEGRYVPEIPQKAHFVMPKRNRLAVFRADLFHGTLPVELETARSRRVFIFNFWRRHTPGSPHCQPVDYYRHPIMRRLVCPASELTKLKAAEAKQIKLPRPVKRHRFASEEEMPHSSDFSRLPRRMPMPSAEQLKACSGLCEVDWSAAVGGTAAPAAAETVGAAAVAAE